MDRRATVASARRRLFVRGLELAGRSSLEPAASGWSVYDVPRLAASPSAPDLPRPLVLDGNFGYNHQDQTVTSPDFGTNYGIEFGIAGTNDPNDIRASGMPTIENGYTIGSSPNWMPLFRKEKNYTFSTALTKVFTRHEMRAGVDVVKLELNHRQAEFGNYGLKGGLSFSNDTTGAAGYISPGWNNFAAFLLGLPNFYGKDVQTEDMTGREWQTAFFVNDRWRPSDRLTLNVGLRIENYPLMSRANSGIERWPTSAGCRSTSPSRSPTSAPPPTGVRRPEHQLRRAGAGQQRPQVLRAGGHVGHQRLGGADQEPLPRAPDRGEPAVPGRADDQGGLHAQPREEHGGRGRLGRPHLEPSADVRRQLRPGRLRPDAQLPARVRLGAAVPAQRHDPARRHPRRLAGERRLQRLLGHAVPRSSAATPR